MPLFSDLTGFGFFEFDAGPSEAEKVFDVLVGSYRDPKTGQMTIDCSSGTYQEAKLYGWAIAIAEARVHLRAAGLELRPETSFAELEHQEAKFGMAPATGDSVKTRRAALAARQKQARGPRYEALQQGLSAILGSNLVSFRSITEAESVAYPTRISSSHGIFRRNDLVAKTIRLTGAVARPGNAGDCDSYSESNIDNFFLLDNSTSKAGQSFTGDGRRISRAVWYLKKVGAPFGDMRAKVYLDAGSFGTTSKPAADAVPIAVSDPIDPYTLGTSYALTFFTFSGSNRIVLANGTKYIVTIEREPSAVTSIGEVDVGLDTSAPGHAGNACYYQPGSGLWNAQSGTDCAFYVRSGYAITVPYESWDVRDSSTRLVAGDVICVDPGNLGLVERVTLLDAQGDGAARVLTACFDRHHSAGTLATTGNMPLWSNTKRQLLIFAKAAAAEDPLVRARIDDLLRRVLRAPTSWAILEPTTPGATTSGPFKLDTSPLGSCPVESMVIAP